MNPQDPIDSAASRRPPVDRERLEREREGGGAPSQRTGIVYTTLSSKLWHALRHPGDMHVLWRHP